MCPTLGVATSAINGLGMGLATAFVLVLSNLAISLVANLIPDKIRIPGFIVIIAAFVTVVDMCMAAYLPSLHESLGLFIPLIVVNCIVLGRAESFASKNNFPLPRISRIAPNIVKAMVKPRPMPKPSSMEGRALFLDASSFSSWPQERLSP